MKNEYTIVGDLVYIKLKRSDGSYVETIINQEDFEIADSFPNAWYARYAKKSKTYYIQGNIGRPPNKKCFILHRMLCGLAQFDGRVVDHINHDGLDNRRENIRIVTLAENNQNKRISNRNSSGHPNVSWISKRRKWAVQTTIGGRTLGIGQFDELEDAIQIADAARTILYPCSIEAIEQKVNYQDIFLKLRKRRENPSSLSFLELKLIDKMIEEKAI